jgi:hypothetical protein
LIDGTGCMPECQPSTFKQGADPIFAQIGVCGKKVSLDEAD